MVDTRIPGHICNIFLMHYRTAVKETILETPKTQMELVVFESIGYI